MGLVVAQIGARRHYAIPRMLHELNLLGHFYTDICPIKGWVKLLNLIPYSYRGPGLKRLLDRVPHGVPADSITAFTRFGLEYSRRRNRAKSDRDSISTYLWAGKKLCQLVLGQNLENTSGVYTFNSAGLELLQYARTHELCSIMEQTIAPRRVEMQILDEASQRYPQWGVPPVKCPEIEAFADREEAEWQLADLILCGSEFVRDGIVARGGSIKRCVVVPYGVDLDRFNLPVSERKTGPLRVLTVGAVGLRKGSPIVLEVAKKLKGHFQFRMVGGTSVGTKLRQELAANVELTGIVPRSQILEHFAWADVFLLPSLCEGSATVTYEAMAAGLPVICTPNSGSIVKDGKEGFIVPVFDIPMIVDALNKLMNDFDLLHRMSEYAKLKSRIGSLQSYQLRLGAKLELLNL